MPKILRPAKLDYRSANSLTYRTRKQPSQPSDIGMKKTLLILGLVFALMCSRTSAQTITVSSPSSPTVSPGAVFNVTIQLSVSSALPTNVTALNLLLATPTTGIHSGVGFFTVKFGSGSANFPTSTGNGTTTSSFDTPKTTGANAGFTVTTPSNDLGANAGGGSGLAAPFSNITVDLLQFTVAPNTPAGTYDFMATLGWPADLAGSFINDAGNDGPSTGGTYAVTAAPQFIITVVPEPGTWAFFGLGSLGAAGLGILRRLRAT
jgi:hypothetical protein